MIRLLAPLGAALVATWFLALVSRRLRPRVAVNLLSGSVAAVFLTVVLLSWVIGLGGLAHDPLTASAFGWCRHVFGPHHHLPRIVVYPVLAVAWWSTAWAVHIAFSWWQGRGRSSGQLALLDSETPLAYAETGRHGGMVVSTGMLAALEPAEQEALFAHEAAHLEHRHDRFLVMGSLASGLPFLLPVVGELRHALERWADEQAAERVGDRRTVAGAIARAALASHDHRALALSMTGADVPARVEALLAPDRSRQRRLWSLLAGFAGSVAVVSAVIQLGRIAQVAAAICAD